MKVNPFRLIKKMMRYIFIFSVGIAVFCIFMNISDVIECGGLIEVEGQYDIISKTTGYIAEVHYRSGRNINSNEVIVELNNKDEELALLDKLLEYEMATNQYQYQYLEAENDYYSKQRLWNQSMISYDEYYEAYLTYKMIQLEHYTIERIEIEIEMLSNELKETVLSSPIEGILYYNDNIIKEGNMISIGETVFSVYDYKNTQYHAEILIPEESIAKLDISNEVNIFVDAYPNQKYKTFTGFLIDISPVVSNGYQIGKVFIEDYEVQLEDGDTNHLLDGMSLSAEIMVGKRPVYKMILGLED